MYPTHFRVHPTARCKNLHTIDDTCPHLCPPLPSIKSLPPTWLLTKLFEKPSSCCYILHVRADTHFFFLLKDQLEWIQQYLCHQKRIRYWKSQEIVTSGLTRWSTPHILFRHIGFSVIGKDQNASHREKWKPPAWQSYQLTPLCVSDNLSGPAASLNMIYHWPCKYFPSLCTIFYFCCVTQTT